MKPISVFLLVAKGQRLEKGDQIWHAKYPSFSSGRWRSIPTGWIGSINRSKVPVRRKQTVVDAGEVY